MSLQPFASELPHGGIQISPDGFKAWSWAHTSKLEHTFPSEATLLASVQKWKNKSKVGFYSLKKHPNVACPTSTYRHSTTWEHWLTSIFPLKRNPTLLLDFYIVDDPPRPMMTPFLNKKVKLYNITNSENKVLLTPKALDPTQTLIPMGDDDNEDVDGLVFPTKMVEENLKEARPTRPHDFRLPDSKQTHQSSTKGVVLHVTVLLATLSLPIKPTTLNEEYLAKHQVASQIFIERDDDTSTKAKETSKMIFARRKEGQGAGSLTHFLTLARAALQWIRQHSPRLGSIFH
uniref:Uncharacterized protein n=1 Tax=Cannabis sativa TaxID=3483 RepID=A0A803PQG7_CANSA